MKFGVICLFISTLVACGKAKLPDGSYDLDFDSELWKNKASLDFDDSFITMRQRMLGDLIDNHLLGKSSMVLIKELGNASDKMDPDGKGPALSYPTGPQRDSYMAIDSEWLIIEFNEKGLAYKYSIRSD
ncbi:hypothetical protein AADZ84_14115 [Colwelliaceae bacterium MEBiC 14330]